MNKKLIALAIASAFAAPLAMADGVTIYGTVGLSVDFVDGGSTTAATAAFANSSIAAGTTQALADARQNRSFAQSALNSSERRTRISSNNSYIGFKGEENLNNDLSAIWQWEFAVAFDNQDTNNTAASDSRGAQSKRNTFAGLKSKTMGSLTLGLQDTPVKTSTGKLDPFKDTLGDYRTIIGAMGGSVRAENSVMYTSPSMGGFTIRGLYGAGNEAGSSATLTTGTTNPRIWSVSGVYDNGPIYAAVAHEESRATGALADTIGAGNAITGSPVTPFVGLYGSGFNFMNAIGGDVITNGVTPSSITYDSKLKTSRVGFGYNFGVFRLGLGYERSKSKLAVNDQNSAADYDEEAKRSAYYVSGAFTLGNTVLKAAYARAGDFKGSAFPGLSGDNTGAKQWTIGADYNFSKRTSVYALYTQVRNDSNAVYALGGGATGIASVSPADLGQDPKGISLGMRHSF